MLEIISVRIVNPFPQPTFMTWPGCAHESAFEISGIFGNRPAKRLDCARSKTMARPRQVLLIQGRDLVSEKSESLEFSANDRSSLFFFPPNLLQARCDNRDRANRRSIFAEDIRRAEVSS
jgi:hypothetical protein